MNARVEVVDERGGRHGAIVVGLDELLARVNPATARSDDDIRHAAEEAGFAVLAKVAEVEGIDLGWG